MNKAITLSLFALILASLLGRSVGRSSNTKSASSSNGCCSEAADDQDPRALDDSGVTTAAHSGGEQLPLGDTSRYSLWEVSPRPVFP